MEFALNQLSRLAFRPVPRQEVQRGMHITARGDYAVRAMLVIASATARQELVRAADLASDQQIPLSFLQGILLDLVRAGQLHSHRGARGGYQLSRAATAISIGAVLRAVTGEELSSVRGAPASQAVYPGAAAGLRPFWLTLASGVVQLLDSTTLADLLRDPAEAAGAAQTAGAGEAGGAAEVSEPEPTRVPVPQSGRGR
jgi:Rrf2 family protein